MSSFLFSVVSVILRCIFYVSLRNEGGALADVDITENASGDGAEREKKRKARVSVRDTFSFFFQKK